MTNEWQEFRAYVEPPVYCASSKHDLSYLGRFSFPAITEHEGLGRILTIIARGYLFRNGEAQLDHARNALCAWCSLPGKDEAVNFGHLASEFPELVNDKGEGWYYRHICGIIRFVKDNPNAVSVKAKATVEGIAKGFRADWKKKVKQLQVPIFALNTKAAWALRFDDILADALELGPLHRENFQLPPETENALQAMDLQGVPIEIVRDVAAYCLANKPKDTDWVVLPVANFDCYYGNTNFSKKWLSRIPKTLLIREVSNGICRVKLTLS